MKFRPGVRVTSQEKLLPLKETVAPLQVRLDIPDNPSDMSPVALTVPDEIMLPSDGLVTVRRGGVKSILRVTLADAVFPSESVTVPETI